jgi:hypothetical protein
MADQSSEKLTAQSIIDFSSIIINQEFTAERAIGGRKQTLSEQVKKGDCEVFRCPSL